MSRKTKNIIQIILIILLTGLFVGTTYFASKSIETTQSNTSTNNQMEKFTPPNMPSGSLPDMNNNDNSSSNNSSSDENKNTPPDKPGDDNGSTPPEKPGEDSSNDNSEMTPPSDNTESDSNSNDKQSDNNTQTPPNMNNNEISNNTNSNTSLSIPYYIAFSIEGLLIALLIMYLIMSRFNKKSIKETMSNFDKILIIILSSTIITTGMTYLSGVISKSISNNSQTEESNATASTTVKSKKTLTGNYTSTKEDESPILVSDGGEATISDATINKKSGDSTNTENSEFTGVNAGILVEKDSQATIKNTTIKTSAKGSNAVFSTGENSKIYISDSKITTTGESSSRGLDATYSGYIEADNVEITTQGGSSATLATDRGEGTVIAKNSKLETNGSGSPIIYSTGDISIENTTGTANNSQMIVIEGKNSATVTDSKLTASGKGNRGDTDKAGVMIYQSMSGDASEGEGTLTAKDSTLTISKESEYYKTAPMFFITNTSAVINLENTKLNYGSNILISAKGTSEWGNTNSNGGNLTLNANKQTLKGDIEIDNISTLNLNLTNKSKYTGTINNENKAKEINIKLDKNSTLTLTADSYITSLEDEDETYSNIDFNGYTLYVNGTPVR